MTTAAELFLRNADRDDTALHFEDQSFTYRQLATEIRRRAEMWDRRRDADRPPHIGVLLDNTPEYVFWLGAAALTRSVVVGINATYRGEELARLITHSDCQIVVTSDTYGDLLAAAPTDLGADDLLRTDHADYQAALGHGDADRAWEPADDEDLFLLIFTSGSTNFPKAVRCTQGRFSRTGAHVAGIAGLADGGAVYSPLPFFHSSSLFTGMSAAFDAQVPFGTRARFSASRTMDDIRRMDATLLTYTGKVLNYILAVPPAADDRDNPLRIAIGNEASESDLRSFSDRFACDVRDSYGSTEGMIIIRRDASMPAGALGRADEGIVVLDPDTGLECPRIERSPDGRLLNAREAIGEIVNRAPSSGFEGYYRNDEATNERFRDGFYWSGDLAYRDADGWFYFAGRSNEWLRVDGENFSAGPVEAILGRYPLVRSVAVYAVPDDPVGDRVMAALEVADPAEFDAGAFDAFLGQQLDLGPKWVPAFVRVSADLPKLASMKIDKTRLRQEAWHAPCAYGRASRNEPLVALVADDGDPC
ncbi:MAG: AMP-binding protein [Acidimicrobiales bacterium]